MLLTDLALTVLILLFDLVLTVLILLFVSLLCYLALSLPWCIYLFLPLIASPPPQKNMLMLETSLSFYVEISLRAL
jgi:hypothetical protein